MATTASVRESRTGAGTSTAPEASAGIVGNDGIGTGTDTEGTTAISAGINNITTITAVQAACRAAPPFTRQSHNTPPTIAATNTARHETSRSTATMADAVIFWP